MILRDQGLVIYPGQGALGRSIFRISTMGAVMPADMDPILAAFRALL